MNTNPSTLLTQINDITQYIKNIIDNHRILNPLFGLILGSGLNDFATDFNGITIIPYADIPHLPPTTISGHLGNLVLGTISNKPCLIMQGRFHLYEGYSPQIATILIRVMRQLGITTLFITGASGALNSKFAIGNIMLITDHINFSGVNPLIGMNLESFGPRFPIMFDIYTQKLQTIAHEIAQANNIKLYQGCYAGIMGPAYATRAELNLLINHSCDAVGMSIVQEAIVAAHSGMQILGLTAMTDSAHPDIAHHATHDQIIDVGQKIAIKIKLLISNILAKL